MKIPLSNGQFTTVDYCDYEYRSRFRWSAQKRKNGFHAARYSGKKYVYMHREILGLTDPRIQGEHRDGDGLNNRRSNLRIATKRQNAQGFCTLRKNKSSLYRGVCWHRVARKWRAYIVVESEHIHLGLYDLEKCAALAYNDVAKKHFGNFAQLNNLK